MKIRSILKLALLPIIFFDLTSCSSVKEIQSVLNSNDVVIDGLKNEWEGKLVFDSKAKLAAGFKNDGENLYICVTTNDRINMNKILRLGMTIWLEPEKSDKKIGIKYPIVDMERMRDMPFRQEPTINNENPEERFLKLIANQKELSIVNEDDYPLFLLSSNDENNFHAKLGLSRESFVYELKVPLSTNKRAKYFLEAAPPEIISIGIETNEFKMEAPGGRSGGGMQPGGGKQSGGGGGRSGRMPGGGRNPEVNFDQIKLLFDVKLAGCS